MCVICKKAFFGTKIVFIRKKTTHKKDLEVIELNFNCSISAILLLDFFILCLLLI